MAWKKSGFCRNHKPDAAIDMDSMLSPEVKDVVRNVLRSLVWMLVWLLRRVSSQAGVPNEESVLHARVILERVHEMSRLNDGFRVVVCEELLRQGSAVIPADDFYLTPAGETTDGSALAALFGYVGFGLPEMLLEMLGFFYIKCLLHPPFKNMFTRCFVRSYSEMIDEMLPAFKHGVPLAQNPPVSKFLDLLSCQLFHNAGAPKHRRTTLSIRTQSRAHVLGLTEMLAQNTWSSSWTRRI
jgi:hypothetical protein